MDPILPCILSNTGIMHFESNDFQSLPESLWHMSSAIIGNNEWWWQVHKTVDYPEHKEKLSIKLDCNRDLYNCRVWSCDATYRFVISNLNEEGKDIVITRRKVFNRDDLESFLHETIFIEDLGNRFVKNNKFKMRVEITAHESTGFRMPVLRKFDSPVKHLTDVILLVEGQKVHIGKQALATHSGFFRAMFYGDFAERSEEEVELKDLKHSEFVDLLNMIFPSHLKFDEHNIAHILRLADRFEVHKVMDKAEQFLRHSKQIPAKLKSELLESYRFSRPENYKDDLPGLFDAFLVTKNKEFAIGKQTMAMHSEYFRRIFFENEDPKDRVEYDEVWSIHTEDFLRLVFKPQQEFTVDNYDFHLHLAHSFEMWKILDEGEQFLLRTPEINAAEKLGIAQKYKFPLLQNDTVWNLNSVDEILKIAEDLSFKSFDVDTMKLLFERLVSVKRWAELVEEERMEAEREAVEQREAEN